MRWKLPSKSTCNLSGQTNSALERFFAKTYRASIRDARFSLMERYDEQYNTRRRAIAQEIEK